MISKHNTCSSIGQAGQYLRKLSIKLWKSREIEFMTTAKLLRTSHRGVDAVTATHKLFILNEGFQFLAANMDGRHIFHLSGFVLVLTASQSQALI